MDRELNEKEKFEYRKQFGQGNKRKSSHLLKISYRSTIKWSVIAVFLFSPLLVKYGKDYLGLTQNTKIGSALNYPKQPIIRVYAARTWGPKGLFAVHSWIAMKRKESSQFEVIQVIGWRQDALGNVLFRETNVPIDSWWGNEATLLLELQGDEVQATIDKVDIAIEEYPWKKEYTLFPGPNSNTFTSWIGLQVPELRLDLPSTAIGKDWRPLENSLGRSASGSGVQASLYGLLGTSIGLEEGIELNVLGLNFELDLLDLAIELPLFGRYEIWYLLCFLGIWHSIRKRVKRTEPKYFYLE